MLKASVSPRTTCLHVTRHVFLAPERGDTLRKNRMTESLFREISHWPSAPVLEQVKKQVNGRHEPV